MASDDMNQRFPREPTESEDPILTSSNGSPTFIRKNLNREANNKVNESTSSNPQPEYPNENNLPDLLSKVELDEKNVFPPRDFISEKPGSSVDYPTNFNNKHRKSVPIEHTDLVLFSPTETGSHDDTNIQYTPTQSYPSPSEYTAVATPQPRLRRKSSSLEVKTVTLPKVNCPEKIFICVDHSEEMFQNKFQTQSVNQTSVYKTLTSAIKQFVCTKSFLNKKHQFSLVMLNEDTQLITDFSSDYEALLYMLNDIGESLVQDKTMSQQNNETLFDLSNMFNVIKQHAGLPRMNMKQAAKVPPPYVIRVVFIYGRSNSRPKFLDGSKNFTLLNNSPFFFIDCVYIHQKSTDSNNIESIFSDICALDKRGTSHVYEVCTDSNMACLYNVFAKLLAHPLQRPKQMEDSINYNLEAE
ncbi:BRISC and BRCA1-A complex member 1-like [Styela clava]